MLTAIKPTKYAQKSAQTQNANAVSFVPCVGGVNFHDPIHNMKPTDAIVLDNFIAYPPAIETRGGYRQFAVNIPHSIISLMNWESGNANKIFATCAGEIYDITNGGEASAFPVTTIENDTTGYWSFINYTMADKKYLLAVNNGAGYWTYDDADGWVKREIEGLPENLTSITAWANRVWCTVENSSEVYYFGVGDVLGGTATPFDYGQMFRKGGYAVAVCNWTRDSGYGVNDYQVIISSEGDVLVYTGTDPSNADAYSLVGVWYIGQVPKGDKFHTKVGGDLYILSDVGIVSMNALVSGNYIATSMDNPIIRNIQPALAQDLTLYLNAENWELHVYPPLDILIVQKPADSRGMHQQYVMCLTSNAWSTFSGMPILTSVIHDRRFFFASQKNHVYVAFENNKDNELYGFFGAKTEWDLDTFDNCTWGAENMLTEDGQGVDIYATAITAFNALGNPTTMKRFNLVMPHLVAIGIPSIKVRAHMDYYINGSYAHNGMGVYKNYLWGSANWGQGKWYGAEYYRRWMGINGIGYYGAIELVVNGEMGTKWMGCQILAEGGGLM